jgi:hypothetical protein
MEAHKWFNLLQHQLQRLFNMSNLRQCNIHLLRHQFLLSLFLSMAQDLEKGKFRIVSKCCGISNNVCCC